MVNNPNIRFAGFSDEWVQRKLGDLADITTGTCDANAMSPDGLYDFYTSGLNKYKINHFAFEGPAIIIAGNGYVGFMHMADGKFNAYQRTYVLQQFKADIQFMFTNIGKNLPVKIKKEARTGVISYIVKDMLTLLDVNTPTLKEQEEIGYIFSTLDHKIGLEERQISLLKDLKKGYLQKMFPKQGATEPGIRFKGFSDAWEQRKLGEVTEKIGSGKTPKGGNSNYQSHGVALIRSQNIFDDRVNNNDIAYISDKVDNDMKNSRVFKNDVLLNITGASIGRSAVYQSSDPANVNQHVCIIRPKDNIVSNFIQLNISSTKGQKEIELNQAGGGREGLNFQQIAKMIFSYPSYDEQQVIGLFFEKINDTITLHQRKLDLLKDLKKGLLQQMFV